MTISIREQIDEVKRELEQRDRVYARLVSRGKMRQSIADFQMARMRAVLKTLEGLQTFKTDVELVLQKGQAQ